MTCSPIVNCSLLVVLMITVLSHLELRDCGDAGSKALVCMSIPSRSCFCTPNFFVWLCVICLLILWGCLLLLKLGTYWFHLSFYSVLRVLAWVAKVLERMQFHVIPECTFTNYRWPTQATPWLILIDGYAFLAYLTLWVLVTVSHLGTSWTFRFIWCCEMHDRYICFRPPQGMATGSTLKGWWSPAQAADAAGDHLPGLLPPADTSPELLFVMPATTPSRYCLPTCCQWDPSPSLLSLIPSNFRQEFSCSIKPCHSTVRVWSWCAPGLLAQTILGFIIWSPYLWSFFYFRLLRANSFKWGCSVSEVGLKNKECSGRTHAYLIAFCCFSFTYWWMNV
jgi:hypothetical protein